MTITRRRFTRAAVASAALFAPQLARAQECGVTDLGREAALCQRGAGSQEKTFPVVGRRECLRHLRHLAPGRVWLLRDGGRLLVVHDYGRDDVSRLRPADLPEYTSWSRRDGWFLRNGFRVRVIHAWWTFESLEDFSPIRLLQPANTEVNKVDPADASALGRGGRDNESRRDE